MNGIYPGFDIERMTLRCADCQRSITAIEWRRFFGRQDMIDGCWEWHCGCAGEQSLQLLAPKKDDD